MSATTTKSLLLSQPKSGQFEGAPTPLLNHQTGTIGDKFVVRVEVPGVDPDDIVVSLDNNLLLVVCELGEFKYSLDPTVDAAKIVADVKWGMLTLEIPSPKEPVSRSIKITIAK